jgi:hypothetical protein
MTNDPIREVAEQTASAEKTITHAPIEYYADGVWSIKDTASGMQVWGTTRDAAWRRYAVAADKMARDSDV